MTEGQVKTPPYISKMGSVKVMFVLLLIRECCSFTAQLQFSYDRCTTYTLNVIKY